MIVLTGIKPTGRPHLGNYLGAIAPALSYQANSTCYYFIADYHALVSHPDPRAFASHSFEVATTWLACGLDPTKSLLYRQSDIPEIFELQWILSCFTAKGLLNRAHAYKAAIADSPSHSPDDKITMGLFCYPVVMAADILVARSNLVPVGIDQKQHVEIARDIAKKFHHHYRKQVFTIPEIDIHQKKSLVGIDGRKMSKSYGNHIPLFCSLAELKKRISKIPTDSSAATEAKPCEGTLYELYRAFSSPQELASLADLYASGTGWGQVKDMLGQQIANYFAEATDRYQQISADPSMVEDILQQSAKKVRNLARDVLGEVKEVIGISS